MKGTSTTSSIGPLTTPTRDDVPKLGALDVVGMRILSISTGTQGRIAGPKPIHRRNQS